MNKLRLLAAVAVATVGLACAVSSASALTVSPTGTFTDQFPSGGLTITVAGMVINCPTVLTLSVSASGATINPNPCNGITFTFLLPWANQIIELPVGSGRFGDSVIVRFAISIAPISCLYTGLILKPLTSGSATIGAPTGTLRAPTTATCPAAFVTMTIGGTGGRLDRAITIR
jgi:hypothetical protein